MSSTCKNFLCCLVTLVFCSWLFVPYFAYAQTDFGLGQVQQTTLLSGTDIRVTVARIINVALGLLGVVAIGLVIYGGYLVLTDVFHPYWSAAVDGNVVEIIQAFHAFRGVKVPAGLHKVEFFCRVPYFKLAFFITFITIVICLAGTFYFWSKKVRPQYKYT
ncbi:MAG: hypothetical protein AAB408_03505 [Patescibacteria group bacterium]